MDEPSLSNIKTTGVETYRFLWLRTFDHPIAVRVQNHEGRFLLWSKQLDGKGGYEPGKLVINTTKSITAVEWAAFVGHIEQASFWTLARLELERSEVFLREVSMDGTMWALEGLRDGQYHYVDRCLPLSGRIRDCHTKFHNCCLYLLELSGLKPDIVR